MDDQKSERSWKTLETKYLIRKPWLTFACADRRRVARRATRGALRSKVARGRARVDKLELPDGRIMPEYYVLEYPDWVNVIAITKNGKFVMERQYRHAAGITMSCHVA